MAARRWFWIPVLMMFACVTSAHASAPRMPTIAQALRASSYTIPAAWAGIWTYQDTTKDCTTLIVSSVDSGADTLCSGQTYEPDTTGGFTYDCTGTVTDTQIDLTCTGSIQILPGCLLTFSQETHATRTGETFTFHTITNTTFGPSQCAFQDDKCDDVRGHMTRTGPAPPSCATPVKSTTWGSLKTRYR